MEQQKVRVQRVQEDEKQPKNDLIQLYVWHVRIMYIAHGVAVSKQSSFVTSKKVNNKWLADMKRCSM